MATEGPVSGATATLEKVQGLLEELRPLPAGDIVGAHIAQILAAQATAEHDFQHACARFIRTLLDLLAAGADERLRVHARLLQKRLTPPLAGAELDTLRDYVLRHVARQPGAPLAAAVPGAAAAAPVPVEGAAPAVERRVNASYREHLNRQRDEIEKLQETLATKVGEAVAHNREFGTLLDIQLRTLHGIESPGDVATLSRTLIGGIEDLIAQQQALESKLRTTNDYLQAVKSDSQRLNDELNKVRLLSLTDESTTLPNRRAFLRRLEDEIARATRLQAPLALALIDLDHFKSVNDTNGHGGGDEVLRCYAQEVLSLFRQQDMVARYGGEEFAVLLPNTDQDGALCALAKIQRHARETCCQYDGHRLKLPTFSAGLTVYQPEEPAENCIRRADAALYRAKHLGRNRIETEPAATAEPEARDQHA